MLAAAGHDAAHARDLDLLGAPDTQIMAAATTPAEQQSSTSRYWPQTAAPSAIDRMDLELGHRGEVIKIDVCMEYRSPFTHAYRRDETVVRPADGDAPTASGSVQLSGPPEIRKVVQAKDTDRGEPPVDAVDLCVGAQALQDLGEDDVSQPDLDVGLAAQALVEVLNL